MTNPACSEPSPKNTIPVVAIGASAGGLEQIRTLLQPIPTDTGAAFFVIQHLARDHESQLTDILARGTRLEVVTIEDGMTVTPNRVHVIPPGVSVTLEENRLRLEKIGHETVPTVIDRFMQALAAERGAYVIGIILSGSGRDGAQGMKAIGEHGGLTLVQDPHSAEHDGMPQAATAESAVHYVLETIDLVEPLLEYLRGDAAIASDRRGYQTESAAISDGFLADVLRLLRSYDKKHDYSRYKPNMLKRRIQRRMGLVDVDDCKEYLSLLDDDGAERAQLAQDLLISVTGFFRDRAAYAAFCDKGLPRLLEKRDTEDTIRLWVPGCASGEEAYSLAIAVDEAVRASGKDYRFILFATDIDRRALAFARVGLYPEAVAADLSEQRLRAYFDKTDDHYQVKRGLRERVVFASQNMINDPPYSRLDAISCRNLLMYLQPETQKRTIATFHFALKSRGLLFLGTSETVSGQVDLFEPLVKEQHLYQRIGSAPPARLDAPTAPRSGAARSSDDPVAFAQPPADDGEQRTRDLLLKEYVPAAVLVNRKLDILCSYGPVGDFFTLPFGRSSLALMEMVHEELRSHLRAVIHSAFRDHTTRTVTAAARRDQRVTITARPLERSESTQDRVLVTFEDRPEAVDAPAELAESDTEQRLADELEATRRELQSTIEAVEASNEDLKGSNEEILSMNEELQSTNEELETSKEELQSVNEELSTVNSELQQKIAELETAHNDLQNLFAGTEVATLFLDPALCIKRFTPAIKALLNLIATDVGRPLSDISWKFDDPELTADAEAALSRLEVRETEIQADNGAWYLRRVLPYRTQDNAIDGVVITFMDISDIKRASLITHESEQRLDLAMGAINGGMWDMPIDADAPHELPDRIYLSRRLKRLLGFEQDQFPNSLEAWRERILPADRAAFNDVARRQNAATSGVSYRVRHRDGSIRWFASHGTVIHNAHDGNARWIGIDRDVTEHKLVDVEARQAQTRLRLLADAVPELIAYLDRERTVLFTNAAFNAWFGLAASNTAGRTLAQLFDDTANAALGAAADTTLSVRTVNHELAATRADGSRHALSVTFTPHRVDDELLGVYLVMTDLTHSARPQLTGTNEQSGLVFLQRMATIGELTTTFAHDIKQPLSAINTYAGALKRMLHTGRATDETTPLLDKIADQVKHANDMVGMARYFVGQRDSETEGIDINSLIHQAVALTEGLARKYHVETHLELHTPLPPVRGHAVQIEQVIINLMVNAVAAMETTDRDRRRLTIATEVIASEQLQIRVADSGEGVPQEKIATIFDPFYTSKLEGTGLGLSLSRAIVTAHGGQLWAESELGQGATFYVTLPIGNNDSREP